MRRVYPGFLQHLGFVAMNPDRHLIAHWDYYHKLVLGDGESASAHRRFYDEYNAVLDMPAEYYLDTVKAVFQDYALPKGRMFVREELVRPQAIRAPALLTIEGEIDDISGHGQTEAAHALCLNIPRERREHFVAPGVGHLLGTAVARADFPARARFHPPAFRTGICRTEIGVRARNRSQGSREGGSKALFLPLLLRFHSS
jgi:polyhydroxyalkanoate depolymerase